MQSNIIGPIALDYWYTLRMLKESITDMSNRRQEKYKKAIDIHRKTYNNMLKELVNER